ncbi:MAG TPA: sugar kinase [Conexibacter sp.]
MTALAAVGEPLAEIALGAEPGEAALGFGGDASNVAVMAARLGAPVRLAARVGDDGLGRRLRAFWAANGVDATGVRTDADAATGLYVNETTADGSHRFVYWRRGSAGSRLAPEDLDARLFERLGVLVVTGITLAVSDFSARTAVHATRLARDSGVRVACVLNHRPALGGDIARLTAFARASDIVVGSREDAEAVFGSGDPVTLRALLADGPDELVLSDGGDPAVAFDGATGWRQPAPDVPVRNAGGAGDALAGAYLAARLRGEDVARSLAWGVAAASLSVGRDGCAAGYPSADEVVALLAELPAAEPLDEGARA